jgi:hypothetical protein
MARRSAGAVPPTRTLTTLPVAVYDDSQSAQAEAQERLTRVTAAERSVRMGDAAVDVCMRSSSKRRRQEETTETTKTAEANAGAEERLQAVLDAVHAATCAKSRPPAADASVVCLVQWVLSAVRDAHYMHSPRTEHGEPTNGLNAEALDGVLTLVRKLNGLLDPKVSARACRGL